MQGKNPATLSVGFGVALSDGLHIFEKRCLASFDNRNMLFFCHLVGSLVTIATPVVRQTDGPVFSDFLLWLLPLLNALRFISSWSVLTSVCARAHARTRTHTHTHTHTHAHTQDGVRQWGEGNRI
jgi:hypothetical protein